MKTLKHILLICFSLFSLQSVWAVENEKTTIDPIELKEFFDFQENYYQQHATASPKVPHTNALIVTENGLETIEWDKELIRHAEQSVELSGSLCGGETFRSILDVMVERLNQVPNLQIHLLTCPVLLDEDDEKKLAEIMLRFPTRFHYMPCADVFFVLPDMALINNHVKMVVVDEKYYTAGGTNKEDRLATDGSYPVPRIPKPGILGAYMPAGVRDMDVVGSGPMAKTLRQQFYALYALWEYQKAHGSLPKKEEQSYNLNRYFAINDEMIAEIEGFDRNPRLIYNASIKMIFTGAMDHPNKISKEYERLMDGAQSYIVVANLYWNPAEIVLKSAMRAVNRGVSFELHSNGINDNSPKYNGLFVWANRINYPAIFYGKEFRFWEIQSSKKAPVRNTRVFEYHVKDILYHKKVMVIDNHITVIGSYNLGTKSDISDHEMVLVIDSKEVAQDVLKVIRRDQSLSLEVFADQAREWYFNPVTAYLAGTQKSFHGFMSVPCDEKLDEFGKDLAKKKAEWENLEFSNR